MRLDLKLEELLPSLAQKAEESDDLIKDLLED